MKRKGEIRLWYVVAGIGAIGLIVWFLVPSPFVRGLVLGFTLAPALLLGVLTLVAKRVKGRLAERLKPPPLTVTAWDYLLEGENLAGERVEFAEFASRVLVLNVWATWCPPCVAEVPASFSSRTIPATYVVDRDGRIAFRHMGAAAWDDPSVVEFIRRIATAPAL